MLDFFQQDQQDQLSPATGQMAQSTAPSPGEAFAATIEASQRLDGYGAAFRNQQDYLQKRITDFEARTGETLPKLQVDDTPTATPGAAFDQAYRDWLPKLRDRMQDVAQDRNDPTLMPPTDADIAQGGIGEARGALARQAALGRGAITPGSLLGSAGGEAYAMGRGTLDTENPLNVAALALGPESGAVLGSALRMGAGMAGSTLYGDILGYDYRRQVDPSYGVGDVASDTAKAFVGGALFGGGHGLGGHGIRGTLGAAAGGAIGGGAIGYMQDGGPGAVQGALGGAALPLAGAGLGGTSRVLGASWRAMVARSPELASAMPLEVRDAGTVAEKAGDIDAQNPNFGTSGVAAHGEAVAKIESDLLAGRPPELPPAAQAEAQVRRGQVFYPGGTIDARYGVAEAADLITSHDADFSINPDYPLDLQPRDRSSAPARDQVANMAGNLEPERLGPSVEANAGAPIVGPDGVVESGNGRTLAISQAYDMGRGDGYRQWLEGQGFDTTGLDKPILVGMRETPLDDAGRAAFAHAANGSASLRMSATEQALSDARLIDGPTLDLHAGSDLASAANRDFARAVVAKLPQGERGGMLTRDGGLSAGGAARVRNALTARAYGDPAFLARALDHPDPNIKAIAGALGDAAGPWARMRDAATAGDILPGHDITRDLLQAVRAVMRARDEGRPAWEVLNQGDMFQSDTTQLAARMLFRDEAMRQPAGRGRVAEALGRYAEEAAKNTTKGRLFANDVTVGDVLRNVVAKVMPGASDDFVLASVRKIEAGGGWLGDMMREMVSGTGEKAAPPKMESALEAALREIVGGAAEPAPRFTHGDVLFDDGDLSAAGKKYESVNYSKYGEYFHEPTGHLIDYRSEWRKTADGRINGVVRKMRFETEEGRMVPAASVLDPETLAAVKAGIADDMRDIMNDEVDTENEPDVSPSLRRTPEDLAAATDQAADDVKAMAKAASEGDVAARAGEGNRPQPSGKPSETSEKGDEGNQPDLTLRNPRTGAEVQAQAVAPLAEMLKRFDASKDMAAHPLARATRMVVGDRLSKTIGDMKVYTVGRAEMRALMDGRMKAAIAPGFEPAGFFDPRSGHIAVLDDAMRDPAEASRLLVHEGLHGAFMRTIDESPAARNVIDHLRTTAMDAHLARGGEAADHYGLTNPHEFVSEAFSNPEFQRLLASIPADDRLVQAFGLDKAPGNSLWDVFVAAVRKIMGLAPDQHTLLDATMRVGRLLDDMRTAQMKSAAEAGHIGGLPGRISDAVDGGAAQASIRDAARDGGQGGRPEGPSEAGGAGGDGRPDGGVGAGGGAAAATGVDAGAAGANDRVAPALRLIDPDARRAAAQEQARKARAMSDAKAAISYRINSDRIAQHPDGPLAGFLGILTRDIHEKGGINVESVQQAYEGRMAEASGKILEPYGSKWAGLKQDVAGIREMIHELFGVDTKNETAKTAADAWKAGVDTFATEEAKRLGKVFTPAEDWRLPQFWESARAQKFGREALVADIDREVQAGGLRVFDATSGQEANPIQRRAIIDEAATRITTDASMSAGAGGGAGAFRTDMRVFRFADGRAGADAYLRLMDKYGAGRGGYLHMMEAHMGKVARELGMLRVLGPDWFKTGAQLLDDTLKADRAQKALRPPRSLGERLRDLPGDLGKLAIGWLESPTKAEAVWQYMSGQASGVGSELMAGLLSGTRAFMTATRMGSAIVTAVPADTVNWLMAARHNGMDMGRMVSAVTEAFLKDNPERREEAARLGIAAHAGMDAAIGTKRFADQFVGPKLMKRMADFVIRAQGIHAWDSAIRRAFVQEFLGTIAQRAGRGFGELDAPFARFLERYGFGEADWQAMSDPANHIDGIGEARYLLPDKLSEDLRTRLMSAIHDERQFAYLAGGSTRVRATSAAAKAGTLAGELARSVFLFKSFPMSMLATWGMRSAREASQGRIGTLAALVTGMTFAGALSMQARALLQGKDPRDMKDPYFWGESFLQGGAAGIYGDFFKEAFSRSDTSLTETMMGPLAAIPAGLQGLTSGARRAAEDGEKVNFGAKLARIISQNTPGGNMWYARLLASRLLFDNIQRMIDRDHDAAFARQQRRAMKTDHQGFFWAPGQNAPGRAPDMGAMVR